MATIHRLMAAAWRKRNTKMAWQHGESSSMAKSSIISNNISSSVMFVWQAKWRNQWRNGTAKSENERQQLSAKSKSISEESGGRIKRRKRRKYLYIMAITTVRDGTWAL